MTWLKWGKFFTPTFCGKLGIRPTNLRAFYKKPKSMGMDELFRGCM